MDASRRALRGGLAPAEGRSLAGAAALQARGRDRARRDGRDPEGLGRGPAPASGDEGGAGQGGCQALQSGTPAVDPRTLGRFLEEAQVTGQLDHPGIVPVHELGPRQRRPRLLHDEARQGARPEGDLQARPRRAGGLERDARAGRDPQGLRGDGLRAQEGRHPPRPEAGQRHGRQLRRGVRDGLGPRARARQQGCARHPHRARALDELSSRSSPDAATSARRGPTRRS